jgi:hypothetical protein
MSGTNGADNAKFNAGCFNGSSWDSTAVGTTSIASNGIYFVAATLSSKTSGTITLYVNGAQEAQTTGHSIGSYTQSILYIGHQWDSGNMSTGTYQGVGAWDTALSAQDILDMYNGFVATPTPKIWNPQRAFHNAKSQVRSRRY